jgi:Uma2 family endonuclease
MEKAEKRLLTAEEFFSMYEETQDRIELIYGKVVMQAAPNTVHQLLVGGLHFELLAFIRKRKGKCRAFVSPYDVVMGHNVVQPDVLVICDPSKINERRANGAPDLVIEISSESGTRDYREKLDIYKSAGVREYWIVDPECQRTLVYLFGEQVNVCFYNFDKPVPVGIFSGELSITVGDLIV